MGTHLLKTNKHSIVLVVLVFILSGAYISKNSGAYNNIIYLGKIRSVAIVGEYSPGEYDTVEIDPTNVKETWEYGEFDPRAILLSTQISSSLRGNANIRVEVDIKVGEMNFDAVEGIDIISIKKTASWKGRSILSNQKIFLKKSGKKTTYKYKYNLDRLMSNLLRNKKWPYMLRFTIILVKDDLTKRREKIITIIPDNKSNY